MTLNGILCSGSRPLAAPLDFQCKNIINIFRNILLYNVDKLTMYNSKIVVSKPHNLPLRIQGLKDRIKIKSNYIVILWLDISKYHHEEFKNSRPET